MLLLKTVHVWCTVLHMQGMCDACLCTVLILGLVFYNDTVLQRTEDLSYVSDIVLLKKFSQGHGTLSLSP